MVRMTRLTLASIPLLMLLLLQVPPQVGRNSTRPTDVDAAPSTRLTFTEALRGAQVKPSVSGKIPPEVEAGWASLPYLGAEVPAPEPNARISLYFMGPPTEDRLRLAKMAELVETTRLPPEVRSELLEGGVKLMMYDWIFAAYEWDSAAYRPEHFLVSFEGPYGRALAYDYGSEELRRERIRVLLDSMSEGGYTAVFFDWFPVACSEDWASEVPGYVDAFRERHPNLTLWEALREFLIELRAGAAERGIDLVIVSNQAYRCGPEPLEYVDWDISEAYFSDVVDGSTELFPWDVNSWESPARYVPELVIPPYEEARVSNPRLGLFHLSYALPGRASREAAFYSFAGARVFGHDGMASSPSEAGGEIPPEYLPNLYWLGCWRGSSFGGEWALGVYDAGVVAVGQAPARVPEDLVGRPAYDLYEGEIVELPETLDFGEGPWGRVFLLLPERLASVRCSSWELEVPVYSVVTPAALEAIALAGGCEVRVTAVDPRRAVGLWPEWREPRTEVTILANDIDWNLTGAGLADLIRRTGAEVRRAPLNWSGLRSAILESKVLIVLGGPESPVLGGILSPLTSALGGPGVFDLAPGRVLIWLWGEDRFATREYALERVDLVREIVMDALSPVPRCHGIAGLTYAPPAGSGG